MMSAYDMCLLASSVQYHNTDPAAALWLPYHTRVYGRDHYPGPDHRIVYRYIRGLNKMTTSAVWAADVGSEYCLCLGLTDARAG